MKAIVFGGAGFLGSHVADELTKQGYDVTIFDLRGSPYLQQGQTMIKGDILNQNQVRMAIQGNDYVYHFAAIADIKEARDKPVEAANFNIMGTMYILDACREFSVKRIMYSSSIYVYSDHGSFYRSSKQACELFVENYHKEYGLEFTVMRYGSLYGLRANEFNFIKNCIKQALIEGTITRQGDGNEIRDYINVVDAARSSVDALSDNYKNCYLMISGQQTMKVREVLEMISEILQNKVKIQYLPGNMYGHYQITPYSFRPKVAIKMQPREYHDMGQGILDCIYDMYATLATSDKNKLINLADD
ncbi:MAG: NAD(P)-dependent oxidoreductase [Sphingobacteriaceae bacterium]|nr:NAD(P)-dependent oxidoreductase [Sphingobacteriaceae bacterium]